MANFEIDEEVLVAFLKGELDAAQAAAVEAWYDRSAANRRMLGQVYYILYVSDRINDAAGIDVERSLRQFKRRMHAGRRISLRRITLRAAAAAAVAVILLAGGVTTVSLSKRLAQPLTVITHLGERSQVVLPDGTKVWLNSASSVEYVAPFFSRERRVKMDGEAYFEVQHDAQAPFVVSTNGLDIKVLGTRFNIRNDDNDHRITTVLLEGAVKAYASGDEKAAVRLRPSQQLVFDTRTFGRPVDQLDRRPLLLRARHLRRDRRRTQTLLQRRHSLHGRCPAQRTLLRRLPRRGRHLPHHVGAATYL